MTSQDGGSPAATRSRRLRAALEALRQQGRWRVAIASARGLVLIFAVAFLTAAIIANSQRGEALLTDDVTAALAEIGAHAGFVVGEVYVVGRSDTPKGDLINALGVRRGEAILAVDLDEVRDRLLALPWVREASVERQLPDTLVVRIAERRPLAIWQNQGQYAVIDERGEVLSGDCSSFSHLPLVVGDDAPHHAAALIRLLATEPELAKRVKGAVRIGSRRWNISLAGGIDVRLPENDAEAAWRRLAEYHRQHRLLDKPISSVDLRLPDRIGVRRGTGETSLAAPGGRGRDA
jgi:cell division protein FtsQ